MNPKLIKNIFFVIISVYAYFNFFTEFIFNSLKQSGSIVFLILDTLFLILGIVSLRLKSDKIYFTLFIVLTLLSQIFNQYSDPIQYLNGFREFIPVFCAPFIIKYLLNQQGSSFINSFNRFLKLFLLLQIPVAILQYKEYGPGDYVGGTLGEGFSGTITVLIYLSTFYLFRYENISLSITHIKKLLFIFTCWIPTFINETKIAFLLLPLFFIFQLQINKGQLFKSVLLILFFLPLMLYTLQTLYLTNDRYNKVKFDQEYFKNYLFGEERRQASEAKVDLPRFLRLELGIKVLAENNYSLFLGKGLGHFKGGTTMDKTEFAKQNQDIMSGSIIYIFFLLMQLGVLGLILIVTYIFRHLFIKYPFQNKKTAIFYFIITLIAMVYGSPFRGAVFTIIFFFILSTPKMPRYILQAGN